ncbi:MAG: 50S ribosomal protein L10 [Candidatus Jacksonbacteria bacterium]|nr:50S ribosomal protein L10 [Candidatus Jacksonbacteria bacterium]
MAKTKAQKQQAVTVLEERLRKAKTVLFATFTRMSISDQETLRRSLKDADVNFTVFKKTLLHRALNTIGVNADIAKWEGNVGVATGADEIAPAKIFVKSLKAHDGLKIRFGMLEGRIIEDEEVHELAFLPSKAELIARLIGTIAVPISSFMSVAEANQRNIVNILDQVKQES